jgi:hypothetical protein
LIFLLIFALEFGIRDVAGCPLMKKIIDCLLLVLVLCSVAWGAYIVEKTPAMDGWICDRASTALDELYALKSINTNKTKKLTLTSGYTTVRDINGYSPVWDDTIRGKILCLSSPLYNSKKAYTTTDGITFTKIADVNDEPFLTLANDLGVTIYFPSIVCLPNGDYLLNAGTSTYVAGKHCSKIYKSTNGGTTWTVTTGGNLTYGNLYPFSWSGIDGSYIVVGEYGSKTDATHMSKEVFLSSDYGSTWTKIYDINDMTGRHIHTCIFDPTDLTHQTVFVSIGDGTPYWGIFRLKYNNETMVWDKTTVTDKYQPTNAIAKDGFIYWGADSVSSPSLVKHNPATDTFETVLLNPLPVAATGFTSYNIRYNIAKYYHIRKIEDLYYMVSHVSSGVSDQVALFVSPDLEHWTSFCRMNTDTTHNGYGYVAGVVGNNLFISKNTTDANVLGEILIKPSVKLVDAAVAGFALTNKASTNDNDSFEATGNNFTHSSGVSTVEISTEQALHGSHSLKATYHSGTYGSAIGPKIRTHLGYTPLKDDYITAVAYVKENTNWLPAYHYAICFMFYAVAEDVNLDTMPASTNNSRVPGGWERMECKAKILGDFNSTADIAMRIMISGTYVTDSSLYIDCVQYYVNGNPITMRDYSEDAVADDMSVVSLLGTGTTYTASWVWWPLSGYYDYQSGTLPIGRIEGANGSYLDVYWNQADKKYKATDGTTTIASTATYTPFFYDCIKFAVVGDGNGVTVYVNDPLNGTISFGDGSSCPLTAQPVVFKAGKNNSAYGFGAYTYVRTSNTELDASGITMLFDSVGPDGVNFVDYSFFAERWLNTDCASKDNCDGTDFDFSGTVDLADLEIFCNYWLEGL